jgi:hypothetical protein
VVVVVVVAVQLHELMEDWKAEAELRDEHHVWQQFGSKAVCRSSIMNRVR